MRAIDINKAIDRPAPAHSWGVRWCMVACIALLLCGATASAQDDGFELMSYSIEGGGGTVEQGDWRLRSSIGQPEARVFGAGQTVLSGFTGFVLLGLLPLAAAGLLDTRGSAEWFIARRYLFAKRRQTFISVITGICVVGVAAGVWLIITVLSVMNGFERTWRDEIIGNRAHFTVHSGMGAFDDYEAVLARVEALPDVIAASPYLDAEGMVRGDAGEIMGVRVRGIDVARVRGLPDTDDAGLVLQGEARRAWWCRGRSSSPGSGRGSWRASRL